MDKPSFKLVGSPCGQHGQYTFYKALRVIEPGNKERILAIGDFFFVRIWQDSELVSIGEMQLLWTDRVSDQTLVSLRLYFLPENTPSGRSSHGQDEVLALNEKVVIRADDLLAWLCSGASFSVGLRAVWRGACAPAGAACGAANASDPLHHTRLDFSDVDKEKEALEVDPESPGVVVFSYPRYCRYRALLARLEGLANEWLRDSLVAALGGYASSTKHTAILYCKDTFEYPELEGHEFVCNHLAPRLKGRPRGRRRRAPRSRSQSPDERSSDSDRTEAPKPDILKDQKISPRRLSLRNGGDKQSSSEEEGRGEERAFLRQLQRFHDSRGAGVHVPHTLKDLSLKALFVAVRSRGGYEAVCRHKLWRAVHADRPARVRSLYERFLLPYEHHERRCGRLPPNGLDAHIDTIDVPDSPLRETPSPKPENLKVDKEEIDVTSKPAEELNREFLESLPKDEKPLISVKPVEKLIDPDKQKQGVIKLLEEHSGLVAELAVKHNVSGASVVQELGGRLSDGSSKLLSELAKQLEAVNTDTAALREAAAPGPLGSLASLVNGHAQDQKTKPVGRSSLRAVRVKPTRPAHSAGSTPPIPPLRPGSACSSPPAPPAPAPRPAPLSAPPTPAPRNNFGIHHPPPPPSHSDDEIVEVPYKPKTPEIIDLDEYPESPQSAKKKKLDILKERGLEVTAIPPTWGGVGVPMINPPPIMLNPAMQHQIMTQASLFQMYNIIPQNYANGIQPPKVIQATCIYGNSGPEKTVYGNPKDPFMPPPHILHGAPVKPQKTVTSEKSEPTIVRQDVLDLTCKSSSPVQKPAVEIVRIPTIPSPSKNLPQNLSKSYTLLDGKAVVGSNLEITLVNPKSTTPPKNRPPQKRSSNGKFVSTKTPTPPKEYPKDYPKDYPKNYPSPSNTKTVSPTMKKAPIIVPNYQINRDDASPTSSTGSRDSQQNLMQNNLLQNVFKGQSGLTQIMDLQKAPLGPQMDLKNPNLAQMMDLHMQKSVPMTPFMDPVYMSALYSTLAGQMDQRQMAMYRDLMASQFRYSGILGPPTTKS